MKKIVYTLGLALLAASCSEDYKDWSVSQANPQEDAKSVSLETATAADVDYAALDSSLVQIFKPTITAVDECTTTYQVTLWNEDKSANGSLAANDSGYVAADELKTVVENLYGKRPVARKLWLDIAGYSLINGQSIKTTAENSVNVTLVAPYISTAYYIVGAPSQWDVMCVDLPFTHSGKDVYEDPVFTVTFPVADGEYWFAIADDKTHEANDWSALLGCAEGNGNNGMEGQIARRTEIGDDGSWKVVVAGDAKLVRMTINMMDYTYQIEKLNFGEWAWLPGDQNGWNHGAATRLQSPAFDGIYTGYSYLNGGFKLTSQADWNGTNYGWATETTLSTDGGAGNLWTEEGFYAIDINCANLTWAVTPILWGVIGDATTGGWDVDTDMIYDTDEKCLTVTLDLVGGKTIKFRANDAWDVNLGGNMDDLSYGGDNIAIAEDGNYTIKLYLERIASEKYYCTITKN